jgi:nucleolar MIF4G domain-containing protein 1
VRIVFLIYTCFHNKILSGKHGHRKGGPRKLSRKEARKHDREQKKQRKADFFTSSRPQDTKRHAEDEHTDSPSRKRAKLEESVKRTEQEPPKQKVLLSKPSPENTIERRHKFKDVKPKLETPLEKLSRKTVNLPTKLPREQHEEHEDAYIAYLESKLGWKKSGSRTSKYGKGMEDDGLDGVLIDVFILCESDTKHRS